VVTPMGSKKDYSFAVVGGISRSGWGLFLFPLFQWTTQVFDTIYNGGAHHVSKRKTRCQGHVGRIHPAVVKVEGVLGRVLGDFPDGKWKRDKLVVPEFIKHFLSFFGERERIA